jgi:GDP/UDP-N,N'-diacetylbacillosamine 2-epimerase (hydrolysing)
MQHDPYFDIKLIVFGTHLSKHHGYTLAEIEAQGFHAAYTLDTLLVGDTPEAIATSMSLCMLKFARFWGEHQHQFDLVFCLGDRYEMFAAVSAGAPFGTRFAHIHGGEKTLGAIDNFFRHSLSHQSWCHFTATEEYAQRLRAMLDDTSRIFAVGALSIDSLSDMVLFTREELRNKYGVAFNKPVVLVTFHPETVHYKNNANYANEIAELLIMRTDLDFVLTLPNVDTAGDTVRNILQNKLSGLPHVKVFDNLGTLAYFSFMKEGNLLFGNSSSGIIEAASFKKYVINLGERQRGRIQSPNVMNVAIQLNAMNEALDQALQSGAYMGTNVYYQGGSSMKIISALKQMMQSHGD